MKSTFRVRLTLLFLAFLPLVGQEVTTTPLPQSEELVTETQQTSKVSGEPPAVLRFEPHDVLETKVHDLSDRQITIQKVAPIELPPIPAPPPPPDPLDPAVQARMQALRAKYAKTTFVMIGATVYKSAAFAGSARTRLTIQGQKGGLVTCWSSADWELLSGTGDFVDQAGRKYALIMTSSKVDLDRWADFVVRRGGSYNPPVIPAIPAGEATFVVSSGDLAPDSLAALGALHDLYNSDLERLTALRNTRYEEQLARDAERRANPPQPKDIVIRHWRMDEAGQHGTTPKPAVTR